MSTPPMIIEKIQLPYHHLDNVNQIVSWHSHFYVEKALEWQSDFQSYICEFGYMHMPNGLLSFNTHKKNMVLCDKCGLWLSFLQGLG